MDLVGAFFTHTCNAIYENRSFSAMAPGALDFGWSYPRAPLSIDLFLKIFFINLIKNNILDLYILYNIIGRDLRF